MRSKAEPMKEIAKLICKYLVGIVARAQTRQNNALLEAFTGFFQATKCKTRGYARASTIPKVIFSVAGKLDFSALSPHVASQTT